MKNTAGKFLKGFGITLLVLVILAVIGFVVLMLLSNNMDVIVPFLNKVCEFFGWAAIILVGGGIVLGVLLYFLPLILLYLWVFLLVLGVIAIANGHTVFGLAIIAAGILIRSFVRVS